MKKLVLYLAAMTIVFLLLSKEDCKADYNYTILHHFSGAVNGGSLPHGSLCVDSGTLYGITWEGGTNNKGTIFSIQTDGTGFKILHSFGGAGDGWRPYGSLVSDGSRLYGMTLWGGTGLELGIIFSIKMDGTGYTVIHSFTGSPHGGSGPWDSLILDSGILYGMTTGGGISGIGTVFAIQTDGTGFVIIHSFTGTTDAAADPKGNLLLNNDVFYGMTPSSQSGTYDGTVFSLNKSGSTYQLLHLFGDGKDGKSPYGSLILDGSFLYGMTETGGENDKGTIFSIRTDGTGQTVLYSFSGGNNDGDRPYDSLILSGTTLYGMTVWGGGEPGYGTLFSIQTDGTGYTSLHRFEGFLSGDGAHPYGNVIMDGTTLYGMTKEGGTTNNGVIFSFRLSTVYVDMGAGTCGGKNPCYTSIQTAINAASTGALIWISQGTWTESITLNTSKSLTLQGGWDSSFSTQTSNTTFIKAPKATQGSLTLQMVTVKP